MQDGKHGRMPKITVGRYSAQGGTKSAPPIGAEWRGWIEPEDKSWILWIRADGTPVFYGQREADGAVVEPAMSAVVGGRYVSAHAVGAEVHVVFSGDEGRRDGYLIGTVAAVTFTNYGKVLYDIEVPVVVAGEVTGETVISRVDSCFVLAPPPGVPEDIRSLMGARGGGSAPVEAGTGASLHAKIVKSNVRVVRVGEDGLPPGMFSAWRRVGDLDVGRREQIDMNVPGKPWVAHEHYELLDGTTGSRRVAFGVDEADARRRGEYNAIMYPYPLMVDPGDEANADYLGL
jgi:hypothetical protein